MLDTYIMDIKYYKPLPILYILLCTVLPWSLAAMQIMLILVCIYFLALALILRKNLFVKNYFYIFPFAYLFSLFTASAFSINPSVAFDNIFRTYWPVMCFPIIASLPLSQKERGAGLHALIISSTVVGLYGIFQSLTGSNFLGAATLSKLGGLYRAIGTYSFYLSFAGNQVMIFAFVFVLVMNAGFSVKKRWMYTIALFLIGLSILATQARSTWLGVVLIMYLGTFLFYRKYKWKILAGSVLVFVIVIFAFPGIADRFYAIFDVTHQNNLTRINLWHTSLLIILDHPFIGIGPGLFHEFVELYKVQGFYDSLAHPHNDILLVTVQSGLIGLITWLLIWFFFFKTALSHSQSTTVISSDLLIVRGAILAIAGILLASLFQCYFTDLENSILWWVILGMAFQVMGRQNFNAGKVPERLSP
jgi:putative inorganic carbon (HCO3(-)) transporter